MAYSDPLARTPYDFVGRRPFREERLVSYIRREHRRGRHLGEILDDRYVHRCGSREFVWATLRHTSLIELLEADVREAFERASEALSNQP
ncbi:MAG TPA: hypothetical protein VKB43_00145 [Gaiellaceae bacterium]|nr:hypothetical protein [Gaiellaceae bacterium]